MNTSQRKPPPLPLEDEVLRRMLNTPPMPHKAKPAPAKKKLAAKRPLPRKPWE